MNCDTNTLAFLKSSAVLRALPWVVALAMPVAHADWREDLKKKNEQIQQDLEKNIQQFREDAQRQAEQFQREAERKTQQAREGMQRSVEHAQQNWQRNSQQHVDQFTRQAREFQREHGAQAARQVEAIAQRWGGDASREAQALYQRHGRELGRQVTRMGEQYGRGAMQECSRILQSHGEAAGRELVRAYERHGRPAGDRMARVIRQHGPTVARQVGSMLDEGMRGAARYMRDEENQVQAVNAIIATAVMYERFDGEKKRMTKEAIQLAGDRVMVQDAHGRQVSLNNYSRSWIHENAPHLRGTSIAEDPAEALTYGVIYGDTDYICNDMKVLRGDDGEYRSIRDAAIYEAGLDADQTLAALEMADSFATLGDEEASAEDMVAAVRLIESMQSQQR